MQSLKTNITHSKIQSIFASLYLLTAAFIVAVTVSVFTVYHVKAYDCGTYSAGDYSSDSCTTSGGTGSGTGGSGGSSGGGSGSVNGGSSGGSPTVDDSGTTPVAVEEDTKLVLNKFSSYLNGSGKLIELKQAQKVFFTINGEEHSVTIKMADMTSLVVTIASTPTDVTVPFGSTVQHDVDEDGQNDIAITYVNLIDGVATLKFAQILPPTTAAPITEDTSVAPAATPKILANLWWFIPLTLVLLTAIAIVVKKIISARRTA